MANLLLKRIKDWATSITSFRTGDVIPVDGPSGTAKMTKDNLLKETAQNALIENIAAEFDPTATYTPGTWVIRYGKLYNTLRNHTGDWVPADFYAVSVESRVQFVIQNFAPLFSENKAGGYHAGSFVTRYGILYMVTTDHTGAWIDAHFARSTIIDMIGAYGTHFSQNIKNKYKLFFDVEGSYISKVNDVSTSLVGHDDKNPMGIVDWLLPVKCIFDSLFTDSVYIQFGSFIGSYNPYLSEWAVKERARTSFAYSGETGCKLHINYSTTSLNVSYIFYFKINEKTGLLEYSKNKSLSGQPATLEIEPDYVFSVVFSIPGNLDISSSDLDLLSVKVSRYNPIETSPLLQTSVLKWQQGGINESGADTLPTTQYYWNRIKTDYLEVTDTIKIDFDDAAYKVRYFVYSSSKVFESWGDYTTSPFSASPSVGKFVRFCFIRKDNANINCYEGYEHIVSASGLAGLIPAFVRPVYDENKFLNGKKVAFIGDSITAGAGASSEANRYVNQFGTITGATVVNLGVNGTCVANNTKNGLGSSRFVTRATSANLSDADLVVVFGGTNDLSYDSKAIGDHFAETTITASGNIGTKQLGPTTDTDTFAGALHDLITTIQGVVAQGTPILFVTPLHRNNNSASNPNSYQCNSNGDFMIDFVNAIKDICGFYAVPVLDLYADGEINPLVANYSYLFSDGLHPNNAGHRVIAERIVDFVENNISFIS